MPRKTSDVWPFEPVKRGGHDQSDKSRLAARINWLLFQVTGSSVGNAAYDIERLRHLADEEDKQALRHILLQAGVVINMEKQLVTMIRQFNADKRTRAKLNRKMKGTKS